MLLLNTEAGPKRLELMRELVPSAKLIALLVNPKFERRAFDERAAARALGLSVLVLQRRQAERHGAALTFRIRPTNSPSASTS